MDFQIGEKTATDNRVCSGKITLIVQKILRIIVRITAKEHGI